MDGAMRDLNLIRETAPEERDATARRFGLFGAAGAVTVLLVVALCAQLGPTEVAASQDDLDPLARLDAISGLVRPASMSDEALAAPEVDRVALGFPEQLTEDPPEVAAALAAAAAEAAHPDALPAGQRLPSPSDFLPASLALTEAPHLIETAARDALVQNSIPSARIGDPADEGHDGQYTIQVISYDSADGAQAFAAGLRARGHRAFVMRAQVEGRGTMFRVRIGPFETMGEANGYRSRFESAEHMNTIVIRRREQT